MTKSSRVKTICTVGPTSENRETLEQLMLEGMDIARMNMSHATHEEFLGRKVLIDEFNKKHNLDVKILLDLQGPRMRVGTMPEGGLKVVEGEELTFTTNAENKDAIFVNDPHLHSDVKVNDPLFLANGDMGLIITEISGQEFKARVLQGGTLMSRKGVNVPDTKLTTRGLTPKDMDDIKFGLEQGVDYVAMSFVQDGEDMRKLREIVNNPKVKLIAKIELKQAILNLDSILEESDLIMVARGDLGIELPMEELPLLQKYMIQRAGRYSTRSIVATQMLLSMVNSPQPTRAEISDVANAVIDGAWSVMLSDETAFGKYPVESLKYLVRTVQRVESYQSGALPQV
jgi:pyruvate kinase